MKLLKRNGDERRDEAPAAAPPSEDRIRELIREAAAPAPPARLRVGPGPLAVPKRDPGRWRYTQAKRDGDKPIKFADVPYEPGAERQTVALWERQGDREVFVTSDTREPVEVELTRKVREALENGFLAAVDQPFKAEFDAKASFNILAQKQQEGA